MRNEDIWRIALAQSAIDAGCAPEDFSRAENVVVYSRKNPAARRYLELPLACGLISYGTNIVASVEEPYETLVREYIDRYPVEHCFETPNLYVLNEAFRPYGMEVCFMAEYFLPDVEKVPVRKCGYETRILTQGDFAPLYLPQWSNALCEKRKELDVLGVGAYDGGQLVGFAACSADCDGMWQIGVDVLPAYRRQGIAAALTSSLAREVLERGKVPFYCCAWSNVKSARNAVASGFRPAWAELTVKPKEFVDKMNCE